MSLTISYYQSYVETKMANIVQPVSLPFFFDNTVSLPLNILAQHCKTNIFFLRFLSYIRLTIISTTRLPVYGIIYSYIENNHV